MLHLEDIASPAAVFLITDHIQENSPKLYIVISRSDLRNCDWSNAHHMMCKNKQCCPVSSVQRHVPTEHGVNHVTHLCRFFGLTAILGRSTCILCCCIMDDNTNLLHLFRDITTQILSVSLGLHWTTLGHYFSVLLSAPVNICIL